MFLFTLGYTQDSMPLSYSFGWLSFMCCLIVSKRVRKTALQRGLDPISVDNPIIVIF